MAEGLYVSELVMSAQVSVSRAVIPGVLEWRMLWDHPPCYI